MPAALAARLPARRLDRGRRARRGDGGGDAAGRAARAGRDRGLRGRTQPADLARVVVACTERLTGDGVGPAAQQSARAMGVW